MKLKIIDTQDNFPKNDFGPYSSDKTLFFEYESSEERELLEKFHNQFSPVGAYNSCNWNDKGMYLRAIKPKSICLRMKEYFKNKK